MSEYRIASRYAKSLLTLCKEQNLVEEIKKDMSLINSTISEVRDFSSMLKSPIIKDNTKTKILETVFKGKIHSLTLSFILLVTKKGRASILEPITSEFRQQYLVFKGIQEVSLTTTFKVDPILKKEFEEVVRKLTNKTPHLTEKVSEDIIGGFVLDIGDRRIDASIKTNLEKIEYELTN